MKLDLPTRARRLKRLSTILAVLALYVAATFALARRYQALPDRAEPRVQIRGGWLYRDGEKFLVKAVGYDPTRPGELPWTRRHSLDLLDWDLTRIRAAGFNAVRTWEPFTSEELAVAERRGLAVLQGIWVDPQGPFADAAFRRRMVEKVAQAVRESRRSPVVIAYLIMNEPRPARVLAEGVETTRAFLRELAAAARALDPGAPIAFTSWPGLEFLDEPSLDLAAADLYPFRPRALLDAVGYAGMVRLWKDRFARDRPLLVTEYGLSVSPMKPKPDFPGGATEAEQAVTLPKLADAVLRSGASGGGVFMWIDCWWKNADVPDDEMRHDPDDGEEWFGLNAMERLGDVFGRPRPALAALRAWNRAVLTLPVDGAVPSREVEVEANVEEEGSFSIEASINGGEAQLVPTVREGPWLRGRLGLLARARGPQRIAFVISGSEGAIARAERIVIPPGEGPSLALSASGTGKIRQVTAKVRDGTGRPIAGAEVRISVTEATRRFDRLHVLRADQAGEVSLPVEMPLAPAVLFVAAALGGNPDDPPLALDSLVLGPEAPP